MDIFFSPSTGGFYHPDLHGEAIPADAVGISQQDHSSLLDGQSAGQSIAVGSDGRPVLRDPPAIELTEQQQISRLEGAITPRRVREAILGVDGGWLRDQDARIAALRGAV